MGKYLFTSESVSEGHPDKVADQISDAILDRFLTEDPHSRVAVETLVTTNSVVIAGEVRGPQSITHEVMEQIARDTIKDIGYDQEGFDWRTVDIDVKVHQQSIDIAQGVDNAADGAEEGAGDQGIMFGYACNETKTFMPAAIHYAHQILKIIADDRHSGILDMLGPDSKSQVTLEFEDGKPVRAHSIVLSTQHKEGMSQEDVRAIVKPYIERALPDGWMCSDDRLFINPTGRFVIGGPVGDCGLTGRKIIVDTYGGAAPHGGGAFSGKDPTKVDRSAAYITRYLAKNIVAAGLARRCTIQLSYAIGVSKPLSLYVDTHGTSAAGVSDEALEDAIRGIDKLGGLTPRGIRMHLGLNKPIYRKSAAYGHFGRQAAGESFPWERTDLVEDLKAALG